MNRRLLLASACLAMWSAAAQAAPIQGQPLHTNKARFRIPYRYDAAEMQRLGAQEIRLYLSLDRGRQWRHSDSVEPSAGRFDFVAPSDGEYWFAVRTLDRRGQLQPPGDIVDPGLKVVVDTRPPDIELTLRELDAGRVEVSWRASDLNLDASTLELEYVQPGVDDWLPVNVSAQASGRTSWSVGQGGLVAVRGTIADLAGNVGNAQQQARVQAAGRSEPRPSVPDFRQPIAGTGERLPDRFPGSDEPIITPKPRAGLVRDLPEARPQVVQRRFPRPEDLPPSNEFPRSDNDPLTNGARRTDPFPSADGAPRTAARPRTADGRRLVNARKFRVGYQVEDVGPSGVGAVEFYITQDGGRTWWKYGEDPEHESPFTVEVPEDGVYGFAIRVRSGVGLADDPPQPGDAPAIVIVVDQTPPVAELLPIRQGQGEALDRLFIRWRVDEQNPSDRPVALSYAANRGGPWEPIIDWQEDNGGYEWRVPPGTPERVFVRLEARDAAGNSAVAETAEPVVIDLSRPTGRIVDVETVETERQR
ncbi:MAG: hypothetical protein WD066_15085 [Planctomycetaceae bacterium]